MTAGYNKHIRPIKKLAPMARITRAEKMDGSPVVLLPIDYLIWSEKVEGVLTSLTNGMKQSNEQEKEIWVLGNLSTVAESEMKKMGWKIHAGAKQQLLPSKE